MRNDPLGLLYTTVATAQEAQELAESVVVVDLAACVNIIPGGTSIYKWEGKVEQSQEQYLLFKCKAELLPKLEEFVKQHHPYDTPAIIKIAADASREFLQYVNGADVV